MADALVRHMLRDGHHRRSLVLSDAPVRRDLLLRDCLEGAVYVVSTEVRSWGYGGDVLPRRLGLVLEPLVLECVLSREPCVGVVHEQTPH